MVGFCGISLVHASFVNTVSLLFLSVITWYGCFGISFLSFKLPFCFSSTVNCYFSVFFFPSLCSLNAFFHFMSSIPLLIFFSFLFISAFALWILLRLSLQHPLHSPLHMSEFYFPFVFAPFLPLHALLIAYSASVLRFLLHYHSLFGFTSVLLLWFYFGPRAVDARPQPKVDVCVGQSRNILPFVSCFTHFIFIFITYISCPLIFNLISYTFLSFINTLYLIDPHR